MKPTRNQWTEITVIQPLIVLVVLLLIPTLTNSQAVITREQEWAQLLEQRLPPEQIHWLEVSSQRVLALLKADTTGRPQGIALLLHPLGGHPNWPGAINYLRNYLPSVGWTSYALQLPVLSRDSPLADYAPLIKESDARIASALNFLTSAGNQNIVIIGQGLGSAMGAAYLARQPNTQVSSFIGISMSGYKDLADWLYTPNSLQQLNLPILDIYGTRDSKHVRNSARARADAARIASLTASRKLSAFKQSATAESAQTRRAGFIAYRVFEIPGADSAYHGMMPELAKRIKGWLLHHASGAGTDSDKMTSK